MRLPLAFAVALLVVAPGTPSYASPSAADPDRPPRAAAVLAGARAVLAGDSPGDATRALLDLRHSMARLSGDDREAAQRVLARPNASDVLCGGHVCVHWREGGLLNNDAPPSADDDADGKPDWVETTLRVVQRSWTREVDRFGYRAPLPDDAPAGLAPGNVDKLDVYLQNVGGQGIYGYAATVDDTRRSAAYLVLDNDYEEFDGAPINALKATAAHEFFHAVQFAYDSYETAWFMESTATWMEEQVYDGVDDNRNYLPYSSLADPARTLTLVNGRTEYGNWVFYQFVSEQRGRQVVRAMWRSASRQGIQAGTAIARALRADGTSVARTFGQFSVASNRPVAAYEEGRGFPRAKIARTWTFSPADHASGRQQVSLDHLTARNYAFTPGTLSGAWRLRLAVNAPNRAHSATALVFLRAGGSRRVEIRLDQAGNGAAVTSFAPSRVRRVVLDVANGSYANNRTTWFRVTAIR